MTPDSSPISSPARGRCFLVAAAVLWSSAGLFAKAPTFADWPIESRGMVLAFWRALFAGALLLPIVRKPRWDYRLVPLVAIFAVMNVTYLTALTRTTGANAIWLQNTAPLWVFFLGVAFLGERVTGRHVAALMLGATGIATILAYELRGAEAVGTQCALASGFTYACVIVFLRALRTLDASWLIALNLIATAVIVAPFALTSGVVPSAGQLGLLAVFGLLQMGLPYVLFARGLREVSSQEGSLIALLEPVLLPVWVFLAVGEAPAPWTYVGAALILAGLIVRFGCSGRGRGRSNRTEADPTAIDAPE